MGMSGFFAPVSAARLAMLQRDPESIDEFLNPDDGDGEADGSIDVDKAWQGLHYLLTGTADQGEGAKSLAIFGGEEFGPEIGLGPARFLTPAQVREVAAALASFSEAELRKNFNPQDMQAQEVYPDSIWVRDGEDALNYLLENFWPLAQFYAEAAERGDAVLQWLG